MQLSAYHLIHNKYKVIAERSRDGSAIKYTNKGGIWMITNTTVTGIPTSHTHPLQLHDLGTWLC